MVVDTTVGVASTSPMFEVKGGVVEESTTDAVAHWRQRSAIEANSEPEVAGSS